VHTADKRTDTTHGHQTRSRHPARPTSLTALLALQRSAGNTAVTRAVQERRRQHDAGRGLHSQSVTVRSSPHSLTSSLQTEAANYSSSSRHEPVVQRVGDDWPSAEWKQEIDELRTGNKLLGPKNRLFKSTLQKYPEISELADAFQRSLLDRGQDAEESKRLLLEMWKVAAAPEEEVVAGRLGRSTFPTTIYRDLHEFVNAKRLWKVGDKRLHPWPFNADAKKPD